MFLLGTNRTRGEGGREGIPKNATPEAAAQPDSSAGCRHIQGRVWVPLVSLVPTHNSITLPSALPQSPMLQKKALGAPSPREGPSMCFP